MGRILAIDYGKRRTGLAVTDMLRITANPLLTIDTSGLLAWLVDYTRREQVDTIVIGYPRQMNGSESETVPAIRACEQQIRSKLPDIPVVECPLRHFFYLYINRLMDFFGVFSNGSSFSSMSDTCE